MLGDRKTLDRVCAVVGCALYWPLLRRTGHFYVLGGHEGAAGGELPWLAAFLLLVAAFAIGAFEAEGRGRVGKSRRMAGAILLSLFPAQAALKLAELFLAPVGSLATLLAAADLFLFVACLVELTYMWASWLVFEPRGSSEVVAIVSFGLSFLAKTVLALPAPAGAAVYSLLPAASVAFWLACGGPARCREGAGREGEARGTDAAAWRTVWALSAFLVVCGVVRGFSAEPLSGRTVEASVTAQDMVSVAFCALLLVANLASGDRGSFFRLAWSALTLLVFFGLLLAASGAGNYGTGRQLLVIGRTCLGLLLWIVLTRLARGRAAGGAGFVCLVFLLVDVVSSLVGYIVVPCALDASGIDAERVATALPLVISFVLIAVSVVLVNASGRAPFGVPEAESPASPAVTSSGEGAFAAYGLTEKEEAVASLLARGNSQKRAAEMMGISVSAVQSHAKAVYRKPGIHSRQELVDMASGDWGRSDR